MDYHSNIHIILTLVVDSNNLASINNTNILLHQYVTIGYYSIYLIANVIVNYTNLLLDNKRYCIELETNF